MCVREKSRKQKRNESIEWNRIDRKILRKTKQEGAMKASENKASKRTIHYTTLYYTVL